MLATLQLEAIGDDLTQHAKLARAKCDAIIPGLGDAVIGRWPSRAWVAEITAPDSRYRWKREFVKGRKDYAQANSAGSRGVYLWYTLQSGKVYEVSSPQSWKRTDRYFARVTDEGDVVQITESEVGQWLMLLQSTGLELTS